ncbi:hypothetical protein L6452_36673 [Arctium lappa]|uniref:Uncharacterized protein n=1 Tax=Arctium lappa TaxID=4217 RepID=A0ACB8YB35_ARCLA|nr:hypothetical protein L6452_36673 [Arctium lappa]
MEERNRVGSVLYLKPTTTAAAAAVVPTGTESFCLEHKVRNSTANTRINFLPISFSSSKQPLLIAQNSIDKRSSLNFWIRKKLKDYGQNSIFPKSIGYMASSAYYVLL